MKKMPSYWFIVIYITLQVLAPWSQAAEVYKHVDEQGKVIFTDQPTADGEKIDVTNTNTAQPVKARAPLEVPDEEKGKVYQVAITSPVNEQLFPNRLVPFTVKAKVTPALEANHRLRLKIDGKIHSTSVTSFTVNELNLGDHTLEVEIITDDDTVIAQSEAITIFSRNPGTPTKLRKQPR